jgi:hypothetical protein
MSGDKSMVQCEICTDEKEYEDIEEHILNKHENTPALVLDNYKDIYEEHKRRFLGGNESKRQHDDDEIDSSESTQSKDHEEDVPEENVESQETEESEAQDAGEDDIDKIVSGEDSVKERVQDDNETDATHEDSGDELLEETKEDNTTEQGSEEVTPEEGTEEVADTSEEEPTSVSVETKIKSDEPTDSHREDSDSADEGTEDVSQTADGRSNQSPKSKEGSNVTNDDPDESTKDNISISRGDESSEGNSATDRSDDETESQVNESSTEVDGFLDNNTGSGKWFALGVGGCGGNLIDALILRAESLKEQEDHPLSSAWQGAIRGLGVVNADTDSELASTYWAQEYKDEDASKVADNYKIGPPKYEGSGDVEERGAKLAKWTLDQDENDFAGNQWGNSLQPQRIDEAQGVMLFHSAVKGTGTGATPTIAKRLNEDVLESSYDFDLELDDSNSVFSSVILPSMGSLDPGEKRNGLVGFARLANEIDAIIPFDNNNLLNAPDELRVPITRGENLQMENHRAENEVFISFLETMSLTSTAPGDDDPQNLGEQVDVQDIYNPANDLIPREDDLPAIIMAPVYGHINPEEPLNRDHLEELVTQSLMNGKLVDFDHQTAWGGALLIAHSGEYDNLGALGGRNLRDILSKQQFLNFDPKGDDMIITPDYYIKIPGIDGLRLCGLFYNPKMERVESWREWAEEKRGINNSFGQRIDEVWPQIETLFNLLGRENMPGHEGET